MTSKELTEYIEENQMTEKGIAMMDLLTAIEKAYKAGGENVGLNAGVRPLVEAVTVWRRIGPGIKVTWTACLKDNTPYGLLLGYIEISTMAGDIESRFPVRKAYDKD